MLRLEVDPSSGTFIVTVRAVHGTVSGALKDILVAQLGGSGAGSVGFGSGNVGAAEGIGGGLLL